jgi:membrane-associated phospholipid phosphatase
VALAAAAAAFAAFTAVLVLVVTGFDPLADLDAAAGTHLHAYAVGHPAFVDAMRALSDVGLAPTYFVVIGLVALRLLRSGRRRPALFAALTMALSPLLNTLVKHLVGRTRPGLAHPVAHASGLSFPSGHSQSAAVAVGILLVLFVPRGRLWIAAPALLWPLAIGFSRVALGVHYVSDVLAGWALGVAWVAVMAALIRPRRSERCA